MEVTYKYGMKCINIVTAIAGVIEIIDRCEIIFEEIIYTNHRGYIINLNLNTYFTLDTFSIDRNEKIF